MTPLVTDPPRVRIPGYWIVGVGGEGALATVYRAVLERLDRPVALKVLHDEVAADPEYRARFLREGRAAGRIDHPNVVRAFEAGEHEGLSYLVMELVPGEDLAERLAREGRLEEDEALRIGAELAAALEAAEAHGMVHRDLKPDNVLLGPDGAVKLADLGLAKLQGDASVTAEGFTVGTVAFLSPEQCRGSDAVDVRSDLYALGAVLYVALSGKLPHGRGENPVLTMERILREEPPSLLALCPELAPSTVAAVEGLMARDPAERPQGAVAARALLEEAREALSEAPAEPAGSAPGTSAPARARRRRRHRRRAFRWGTPKSDAWAAVVVALVFLGCGLGLWVALRSPPAAPVPQGAGR